VGQPRYTPVRYDRLAAEGFNANAVVYRCVTDIAQGIGSLSWTLRRKRAADFFDTHPLLTLLARGRIRGRAGCACLKPPPRIISSPATAILKVSHPMAMRRRASCGRSGPTACA
jgi:hypothetical protein